MLFQYYAMAVVLKSEHFTRVNTLNIKLLCT